MSLGPKKLFNAFLTAKKKATSVRDGLLNILILNF